jgi:glycosyltransferase involved in cell wall biosynthesis
VSVTAVVPCFNNAETIARAVESVLAQGVARGDVMVIDDGSSDDSVNLARSLGVEVKSNGENRGRGFTRARATREARHDLILSCDATKSLAPDFLRIAREWLKNPQVAVAFGHVLGREKGTVVERWESRHLFLENIPREVNRRADLATPGALFRRSTLLEAGNFNENLRHSEDADIGARLLAAGFEVVADPSLRIYHLQRTRFWVLMERYWRWHAGADETTSPVQYLRSVSYSIKGLALQDLAAGDWAGVPISLLMPHYQYWRSVCRRFRGGRRK